MGGRSGIGCGGGGGGGGITSSSPYSYAHEGSHSRLDFDTRDTVEAVLMRFFCLSPMGNSVSLSPSSSLASRRVGDVGEVGFGELSASLSKLIAGFS